jgi:DNA-binding MarR family transcriptional regulator
VAPVAALQAEYLYTAQRVAEDHGLTAARWQVLSSAAGQRQSVAGIAGGLGLARQSVQRVADDLVASGLATWAPNPRHARAKLLLPSPEGVRHLEAAASTQAAWLADVGLRLASSGIDADAIAGAVHVLDATVRASERHWNAADQVHPA